MMEVQECNKLSLKRIRELLGLSQRAFAKALNVRYATVSDWECGKSEPHLSIPQIKALDMLLEKVDLKLRDLPDDLSQ